MPGQELAALSEASRAEAHRRWLVLRPHLEDGVPLARVAAQCGIPYRTLQRWLSRYQEAGLAGLARAVRADRGRSRFPEPLRLLAEGLALRAPAPSAAHVHRQVAAVAEREGWPVPSYSSVCAVIRGIDPALRTLAVEGARRYAEVFELVHRREAARSNEIWQADHTQLDLWVVTPQGTSARPWLTVIEDDHSRAIAGYAVSLAAPSALQTALALRQAIWRKAEPGWHVCGIPAVLYTDHGSDFTSRHIEQAAAGLGIRLVFSLPGRPRGRGKIERYMDTINQMCLPALPGHAPRGTRDRAGQARLTLAELDTALGAFITGTYNHRVHGETGQPPQARWEAGGFLPRLPESLEELDLLLLTVARPRKIRPDGIRFQGLRYAGPVLAAYVGETVIIRYDPRDLAEIRVFHHGRFLARAICPDLAAVTVSLKDITAARSARRRELRKQIGDRASVVDRLIAVHAPPPRQRPSRRCGSGATGRSNPGGHPGQAGRPGRRGARSRASQP
jgi:putative transposase